jgi:hypothetical protein
VSEERGDNDGLAESGIEESASLKHGRAPSVSKLDVAREESEIYKNRHTGRTDCIDMTGLKQTRNQIADCRWLSSER